MRVLLILGALVAVVAASTGFADLVLEEWQTYKAFYNKNFDNDLQDKFRMKVFIENRINIAKHNARYARGEVSYALGVNHFTDMLLSEFVDKMNGFNRTARKGGVSFSATNIRRSTYVPTKVDLPDSVDWRKHGAVTPIKDQGRCGSCYAFSATGSLEGQNFLKTGHLVSLSEQNILDCTTNYGNNGCDGGLMDNAFKYIHDNDGIDTEDSYPYEAMDESCRYNATTKGATDSSLVDIKEGDEEALKHAVATVGPISVGIDASQKSMKSYKTGVYFEPACNPENLDHAVLVVGYDTDEKGQDYWIVKNSWGSDWGEDGYVRMARNHNNHCGIASAASYPVV